MNDSKAKIDEIQKQTNTNVQEKANLIWEIATHLYGEYKPHEYGILRLLQLLRLTCSSKVKMLII